MENDIYKIYKNTGALLEGHFILSSEKHSSVYLQSAIVLSYPKYLKKIGKALAKKILKKVKSRDIDVIVSPAMGGVIIGSKIGEELNKPAIFVERVNNNFIFRRGFSIKKNTKVFIIEDVITTGKSSLECQSCIQALGGEVVGIASIVERCLERPNFKYPYTSLLKIKAPIYFKKDLPDSLKSIPAIKPGSRFLK